MQIILLVEVSIKSHVWQVNIGLDAELVLTKIIGMVFHCLGTVS